MVLMRGQEINTRQYRPGSRIPRILNLPDATAGATDIDINKQNEQIGDMGDVHRSASVSRRLSLRGRRRVETAHYSR